MSLDKQGRCPVLLIKTQGPVLSSSSWMMGPYQHWSGGSMGPPWRELSPEELSYNSRLGDPLSLRLHCGSPLLYLFGLFGQPHGLHNSIDFLLSLWGGGDSMKLRMSGPSCQPLSTFIHFLFLPSPTLAFSVNLADSPFPMVLRVYVLDISF